MLNEYKAKVVKITTPEGSVVGEVDARSGKHGLYPGDFLEGKANYLPEDVMVVGVDSHGDLRAIGASGRFYGIHNPYAKVQKRNAQALIDNGAMRMM